MNRKLNPSVKSCKQVQSFLWERNRLSQIQKKKIVLYKKKKMRQRFSEYANQLFAKQQIASVYGKLSKKFLKNLTIQTSTSTNQGNLFICLLEMRLDTCLFRMNLGPSFVSIRQYITHGFVFVNGRKLNISSSVLKPGDIITVKKPFPLHWKTSWFDMLKQKHLLKYPAQHLEINYKLCKAIVLFFPQQIYYPCQFQVESALRFLSR